MQAPHAGLFPSDERSKLSGRAQKVAAAIAERSGPAGTGVNISKRA